MTATTSWRKQLRPGERRVIKPREKLHASQWADRYRRLPSEGPRGGQWDTNVNPPAREIMDSWTTPGIESITVMGSTQWGKTESILNCLFYTVDQDPVPIMLVMPTREEAVSFSTNRLKPAIEATPVIAKLKSGKKAHWKTTELNLGGCLLTLAWSNSPARLSSRSCGRAVFDECDKYGAFAGREADPISLAEERLRWWHDRKAMYCSTPTNTNGYIWRRFLLSDRRSYLVPCVHCGHYQPLTFGPDTVVWPKDERDPQVIRTKRLAAIRCTSCRADIADSDENKRRMISRGIWVPEGGEIRPDGTVTGGTIHRGYHLNCLYSPVLTWSECAAQYLRSVHDVSLRLNWTNSWLGWPWIEKSEETTADKLRDRATAGLSPGICPEGTVVLTAGIDVRRTEMHYVIRAWGIGERKTTIEVGVIPHDFDELFARVFARTWPISGTGGDLPVRLACIDSQGGWTDDVYRFCANEPMIVRPIKGLSKAVAPFQATRIERDFGGKPIGLQLWSLDTTFFKDKLFRSLTAPLGAPGSWSTHENPQDVYLQHLVSEHKTLVRNARRKVVEEVWVERPGGGANHWFDAEVYAEAAGDMLGTYTLREGVAPEQVAAYTQAVVSAENVANVQKRTEGFIRRREGEGAKRSGSFIRKRGD